MVGLSSSLWALVVLLSAQAVTAGPSTKPEPTRGSLTILTHNDLTNKPAAGSGAILIDHLKDHPSAVKACNQLSESLWVHKGDNFDSGLKSSLAYQVHLGNSRRNAKFWVAQEPGSCKCQAISVDGSLHDVRCSERLPILCTQSAPVSDAKTEDTSSRFQVTQKVGDAQFTGYRDFFAWKFRGIRFAPTPQRFEYSTTLRNAKGPISALKAGPDCLQRNVSESSEDCLFLNIWTPTLPSTHSTHATSKKSLKPVLVYIYGGAFVTGSGKNPNMDQTNIASRGDVVAVSINHRLGNLGMIAFNDGVHRGNIAINDQISALKWVAENIAAFGGDPDRVTIAGESSGAVSVRCLIASPEARGLFAGAIQHSDAMGGLLAPLGRFWTVEQSYAVFTKTLLNIVNCTGVEDEVACLRTIPAEVLASVDRDTAEAKVPVVDGKYLTTPYLHLDGSVAGAKDIALLTGVVRDEFASLEYLHQVPWPFITYKAWSDLLDGVKDFFQIDPEVIRANLPLWGITQESNGLEIFNATVKIITANSYTCLDRAKAYSAAKNAAFKKVYSFNAHRTYSPPVQPSVCYATITPDHPFGDPSLDYYRCHGGTQATMFGTYERIGLPDRDGLDLGFSQLFVDYMSSFVHSGNPNPDKRYLAIRGYDNTLAEVRAVGEWKEVDASSPEWMILEPKGYMAPFGEEKLCAVLGQPLNAWEA